MGWADGASRDSRRSVGAIVALALVTALVVGCANDRAANDRADDDRAPGAEPERPAAADRTFRPTLIAKLPTRLTAFAAAPDGTELLVGDRSGVIRRLERRRVGGATVPRLEPEPVLDLSPEVSELGERGFFALAFSGDGSFVVASFTAADGAITLLRLPYRAGQPIDRAAGRVLVSIEAPYAWHHGGDIAVAEGGDMFLSIGDTEFRQLDPPGPQDPALILGGILRIPASVVNDPEPTWRPTPADMVARGLRNPWRISLDPATGDLWIGDVGLDQREEVDLIPADELDERVTNFGWPYREGTAAGTGNPAPGVELTEPVVDREHGPSVCGVVGGHRYRGAHTGGLTGAYVYGDLCSTEVRALRLDDDRPGVVTSDRVVAELPETLTSFGVDRDHELYGLGSEGGLYRFDPRSWEAPPNDQGRDAAPTVTTTVPRSRQDCDGVVGAMLPLSDIDGLGPAELEQTFSTALGRLDEIVPTLPPSIAADGLVVRRSIGALARALASSQWESGSPGIADVRADLLAGRGDFVGFPEAMARIVDSECG